MNGGFILLYRQITEWEWYQNPNTFRVFLHCLLMANFADGRFEGLDVKRGQFVTSLPSLSKQTKLTIQQVRTALDHLKSTGEITDKTYPKYRVITVVKYNDYQQDNRQNNSQTTGNQHASNSQVTVNQQQYNNNNKNNNEKREKGNNDEMALLADDDAREILHDHDRVLNAAEDAGMKMSNDVRATLIALYAEHGLQKILDGLRACVEHGAPNLAYLKGVLRGEPRKAKAAVTAQAYSQRDYDGEQADAMRRMLGKIPPAQRFSQRDYSHEDEDAIERMLAMDDGKTG